MLRAVLSLAVLLALAPPPPLTPGPAAAQVPLTMQVQCLSRQERRAMVRSGLVVRPGRIGRRFGGKVLRLDLCRGGSGLVWVATILRGDGRVVDLVLDAQSGRMR